MDEDNSKSSSWTDFQIKVTPLLTLPKFRKDDWYGWSRMALVPLRSAGLDRIVLGKVQRPSTDDKARHDKYRYMSRQARIKLLDSLPKVLRLEYRALGTAAEIWSKLQQDFAIKAPILYLRTLEELNNLILRDNDDFDIHMTKFNATFNKMVRLH